MNEQIEERAHPSSLTVSNRLMTTNIQDNDMFSWTSPVTKFVAAAYTLIGNDFINDILIPLCYLYFHFQAAAVHCGTNELKLRF